MAACDNCGEVVHRVLKGKMSSRRELVFEGVVKCQKCGNVRTLIIREPRPVKIRVVLSWMQDSKMLETDIEPDAVMSVGDNLELESGKAEITAIESGGRRVPTSRACEVDTLWAKRADQVRVKMTVASGRRAFSKDIFAAPDEEFCVGDLLEIERGKVVIEQIKTERRTLHKGCATASEIKRLHARTVNARTPY